MRKIDSGAEMEFKNKTFLGLCFISRSKENSLPSAICTGFKSSSTRKHWGPVGNRGAGQLSAELFPCPNSLLSWKLKWEQGLCHPSFCLSEAYSDMQKLIQELILRFTGHEQPGFKGPVNWKVRLEIYSSVSPIAFFPLFSCVCFLSLLSRFLCSLILHRAPKGSLDLSKIYMHILFALANLFLGVYVVDILAQVCKNRCGKIFGKKTQKQSKCPSIRDNISNLWHIYSIIYVVDVTSVHSYFLIPFHCESMAGRLFPATLRLGMLMMWFTLAPEIWEAFSEPVRDVPCSLLVAATVEGEWRDTAARALSLLREDSRFTGTINKVLLYKATEVLVVFVIKA